MINDDGLQAKHFYIAARGTSCRSTRNYSTICLFFSSLFMVSNSDRCVQAKWSFLCSWYHLILKINHSLITVVRRITTFRSTTDRIYDGGPIRLYRAFGNVLREYKHL